MVELLTIKATPTYRERHYQYSSRYYNLFGLPIVAYVPAECTYRTLYTTIIAKMGCVCVCYFFQKSLGEIATSKNRGIFQEKYAVVLSEVDPTQ